MLPNLGWGLHFAKVSRRLFPQSHEMANLQVQINTQRAMQTKLKATSSVESSDEWKEVEAKIEALTQELNIELAKPVFGSLRTTVAYSVVGILLGVCSAVILICNLIDNRTWKVVLSFLVSMCVIVFGTIVLALVIYTQLEAAFLVSICVVVFGTTGLALLIYTRWEVVESGSVDASKLCANHGSITA